MNLRAYLKSDFLFLDGATGTQLQKAGLTPGELPERWNLTHPEAVKKVHKSYFAAGSNVICTNTFGANLLKFDREELEEIIAAAVKIAKEARAESATPQEKFIALDIGPSGKLLKPMGDYDFEDAVSLFAETVKIGVNCGVDLVYLETLNDSYETKAALLAVKEVCDLPVFVSNVYGEDGRLLNGASPEAMVALLEGMGVDALGANCSLGPKQLKETAKRLISAASVPVLLKPNAGLPRTEKGKTVFDISPAEFAAEMKELLAAGLRVAGGCCGTTPDFIAALTAAAKDLVPQPVTEKNLCTVSSYTRAVTFGEGPILIGERINPTGKKRFQQALREGDMGFVLNEGLKQQEKGVHLLDVNVGLPEIDEVSLLSETVTSLQAVSSLPLQIDTANPVALEKALRCYNGKALINSVNGKEESMAAVFPLAKQYGGVVIALTLDESGIPSTADGRMVIAEKILKKAVEYGLGKQDLIFDPLAMTVSADQNSPAVTLECISRLTALGCYTSLGVSNVSFGLPQRDIVNGVFFAAALERGLSAAILNPHSTEMMKTYYTHNLLHGRDENCAAYLAFAQTLPDQTSPGGSGATSAPADTEGLEHFICKGLKERAKTETEALLNSEKPLDIVNLRILPALDRVGKGFEEKTLYLPQLLMAAEAAKSAFSVIKSALPAGKGEKGPVVLATVHGDIHDIGKNIVKLLLENYGFAVVDLGKDVSPAAVLEAAKTHNAPLVGLSALMTTTVPAMEETVHLLHTHLPRCKVAVGGAVLTAEYAQKIGADFYGKDALATVKYAETIVGEK